MLWLVFLKQDFTSGTFQRHLFNSLAKRGVAIAALPVITRKQKVRDLKRKVRPSSRTKPLWEKTVDNFPEVKHIPVSCVCGSVV